jgi:N4-gp56 family major capsid protein
MVFAEEAFGIVPLKGYDAVNVHWENPKRQLADPLAQRGFASWKTYQACVRVNESWMDRWEHAVAA